MAHGRPLCVYGGVCVETQFGRTGLPHVLVTNQHLTAGRLLLHAGLQAALYLHQSHAACCVLEPVTLLVTHLMLHLGAALLCVPVQGGHQQQESSCWCLC